MASELTSQNALLLLKDLMGQTNSWIFNRPVDYVALNVPTYPEVFKTADPQIIKRPMDLGAIKSKVEKRAYISLPFFRADVELVFSNAIGPQLSHMQFSMVRILRWASWHVNSLSYSSNFSWTS